MVCVAVCVVAFTAGVFIGKERVVKEFQRLVKRISKK